MQAAALFKVMKETPPIPETLSSEGKDFLRCCFKRNPAERPTAAVLLEHRFLKNSQLLDVLSSTQLYNETSFMVNTTVVPLLYLSNHAIYLVLKFSFVCRTNHILQVCRENIKRRNEKSSPLSSFTLCNLCTGG